MNYHRHTIFLFAITLVLLIAPTSFNQLFAQGNTGKTTSELLIGTWTLEYNTSKDKMSAKAKAHYDKMDTKRKDRLEKAYKGRKVTFGKDSSYLQQQADGRQVVGTWKLIDGDQTVEVTNQKGTVNRYKLEKLTSKKLVLNPEINGPAKMIMAEWHFIKN